MCIRDSRIAKPGQPEPAIVYQRVTDRLKEILLVDRLSERTATIDDQGVRQPIGAFGVQTVLLLGFSVHGSGASSRILRFSAGSRGLADTRANRMLNS